MSQFECRWKYSEAELAVVIGVPRPSKGRANMLIPQPRNQHRIYLKLLGSIGQYCRSVYVEALMFLLVFLCRQMQPIGRRYRRYR